MKEEINTLELHYIIEELQALIGSKVEKVYQLDDKTLLFTLHTLQGKKYLHIKAGKHAYLGDIKPATPEEPTGFCTYLRKKLLQTRIRAIEQAGFERIICVSFETKTGMLYLYGEFFQPGNIILCENGIILSALAQQQLRERTIKPKQPYLLPQREVDIKKANDAQIIHVLQESEKLIGKVLASDFLLGGLYADDVLAQLHIDKETKANTLNQAQAKKLVEAIKGLLCRKKDPQIIFEKEEVKEILPFPLEKYAGAEKKTAATYNAAFDQVYTTQAQEKRMSLLLSQKEKEIEKLQTIIDMQKKQFKNIQNEIQENQQKGEMLYEKFHEIETFIKQIEQARKSMSWKEIKEKNKGKTMLVDIDEKLGEIVIDL